MRPLHAAAVAVAVATTSVYGALHTPKQEAPCDVLVAGGSLASLAAAVTAANATRAAGTNGSALSVCYLDITDWPGGQMTASAVPAIDFGQDNRTPANLPASLAAFLFGPAMPGLTNLGDCWVSYKCFVPQLALEGFITPLLAAFSNLRFYPLTAVLETEVDAAGRVASLTAVRRSPVPGTTGWEQLTSAQLSDWYDPTDSAAFTKQLLHFPVSSSGVVIEATEFGDVLMTGGFPVAQGFETPNEDSKSYDSSCGQGTTVPFYMTYSHELAPSPDPVPPGVQGAGNWAQQGFDWERVWTYRRVEAVGPAADTSSSRITSSSAAVQGETSVMNVGGGDDYDYGYVFLPLGSAALEAQLGSPGAWRGGINLTALAAAEQRSFAFYHHYKGNASADVSPYLLLNTSLAATSSGLSKMPYLRDSRRSAAGLDGYRLMYADLSTPDPGNGGKTAIRPGDAVAIGTYWFADIHKEAAAVCTYPAYLQHGAGAPVLPYYIPFRALTVDGAPNLLVAGKSLAQSFWANAATRLHPEEWGTGAAAGAAAVLMAGHGWNSTAMFKHMHELHLLLSSPEVAAPIEWTL